MKFVTDNAGNKCVALNLEREPIPSSVELWEGGYKAPPVTLEVTGHNVVFKFSAFSSCEEYQAEGPIYQVKYFAKE